MRQLLIEIIKTEIQHLLISKKPPHVKYNNRWNFFVQYIVNQKDFCLILFEFVMQIPDMLIFIE